MGNTNLENIHRMKYMKITVSATLLLIRKARHSWRPQFLQNQNPKPITALATVLCFRKEVNDPYISTCFVFKTQPSCENEGRYFSVAISSFSNESRVCSCTNTSHQHRVFFRFSNRNLYSCEMQRYLCFLPHTCLIHVTYFELMFLTALLLYEGIVVPAIELQL